MYRAKLSTADSLYLLWVMCSWGKITLVAVLQKSSGFEQNQEKLKELLNQKLTDKSELNQCLFSEHLVA